MADDKKSPVAPPAEIHIDEFLKGVEESETMKVMFRHFYAKLQGIEQAGKADFEKLFEQFKDMPASDLK